MHLHLHVNPEDININFPNTILKKTRMIDIEITTITITITETVPDLHLFPAVVPVQITDIKHNINQLFVINFSLLFPSSLMTVEPIWISIHKFQLTFSMLVPLFSLFYS